MAIPNQVGNDVREVSNDVSLKKASVTLAFFDLSCFD